MSVCPWSFSFGFNITIFIFEFQLKFMPCHLPVIHLIFFRKTLEQLIHQCPQFSDSFIKVNRSMEHNGIIHLSDRDSLSPHRQTGKRVRVHPSTPIRTNRPRNRRRRNHLKNNNNNSVLNNEQVIDLDSSSDQEIQTPNNSTRDNTHQPHHYSNRSARRQHKRRQDDNDSIEVINLASDTSPSITPKQPANTPGKRRRKQNSQFDDVEILLHSPPKAATMAAAAASAPEKSGIELIREVFPTLSRSKVQSLLTMAQSYAKENDAVHILMTLLPDDPTGESITEKDLAAAAVGGRIDDDNTTTVDNTTGQPKVAQLECNCCYAEYDYEDMVSCKKGHLFCVGCLQRHTETRVFGLGNFGVDVSGKKEKKKALEILCMHSDGCGAGFREGHLRRALSEKVSGILYLRCIVSLLNALGGLNHFNTCYMQVMKKYDELQYQAVIEGFSDTSKCPKCDYIAFADETVSTFHCPQCNFKSCRECGEEAHPGIRCDEVETKHETSGRNKVEEAMTNAVIRKCPRPMCRKPFMKTGGCNKITCR